MKPLNVSQTETYYRIMDGSLATVAPTSDFCPSIAPVARMRCVGFLLLLSALGVLSSSCQPSQGGRPDSSSDQERIEREYAYFQSLDAEQQRQLSELDQFLNSQDAETRARLERVLNNYNYWLSQLSEKDRQSVLSEKNWDERFKAIRRIKDNEWIETLPKAYRNRYAGAGPFERIRLVELWREEQKKRRQEWQLARDDPQFARPQWEEFISSIGVTNQRDKFRKDLDAFVEHMASQAFEAQAKNLALQSDQAIEERGLLYYRRVFDLSERHTLLPGPPDGPRTFNDLPKGVKEALEKGLPKPFSKKEGLPKKFQSEGRWPDLAIAVVELARSHRIALPEHLLGPTTKTAFDSPDVQAAIVKLENQLKRLGKNEKSDKAEQAIKDLKRLNDAEYKWPDYPRAVMDLARQYKIEIPGWMLPGPPELWSRFRPKREPKKG